MKEFSEEQQKALAHGLAMATCQPFQSKMGELINTGFFKSGDPKEGAKMLRENIKASIEAYIDGLTCEEAKFMLFQFAVEQGVEQVVKTTLESINDVKAKRAGKEGDEGFAM